HGLSEESLRIPGQNLAVEWFGIEGQPPPLAERLNAVLLDELPVVRPQVNPAIVQTGTLVVAVAFQGVIEVSEMDGEDLPRVIAREAGKVDLDHSLRLPLVLADSVEDVTRR